MNTRLIMTSSAIFMGLTGITLTFLPEAIAPQWGNAIVVQILGALYFGFAIVNWMSKGNLIGGIYNRPLAVGNLSHFLVAALALIKVSMRDASTFTLIITVIYSLFAAAFGYIMFTHPVKESKTE